MAEVVQVSFEDKYTMARASEESVRHVAIPFVAEHMGEQAIRTLKRMWDEGMKVAPREATPSEQYGIAYGNWIWTLRSAYDLIRVRMGEEGVQKFQQAQIEALRNDNAAPSWFKLMRPFARGAAFKKAAREIAQRFEWLSPMTVTELTGEKAVFETQHCKLFDYDHTEDICKITCQTVYPAWLSDLYRVKMEVTQTGEACRHTLTRAY